MPPGELCFCGAGGSQQRALECGDWGDGQPLGIDVRWFGYGLGKQSAPFLGTRWVGGLVGKIFGEDFWKLAKRGGVLEFRVLRFWTRAHGQVWAALGSLNSIPSSEAVNGDKTVKSTNCFDGQKGRSLFLSSTARAESAFWPNKETSHPTNLKANQH